MLMNLSPSESLKLKDSCHINEIQMHCVELFGNVSKIKQKMNRK